MPVHPTLGNTAVMKREHARVIQRGERRMPRPNEPCDMSCAFSFCCANYNDNGTCKGFLMLSNGKLERHIRDEILPEFEEPDQLSLQNYIRMIQQTDSPEILSDLVPVVYRYLKPPEKKEKLRTMIGYEQYEINENGSLSVIPEPQHKKSQIPDPEPIHMVMLKRNMNRSDEER